MAISAQSDGHHGPVAFFASNAAGGVGELWHDLAEGLAERRHDSRLVALYARSLGDDSSVTSLTWDHICPSRPSGLSGGMNLIVGLVRWLKQHRPAVIVTAMPGPNMLLPVLARMFSPSSRLILTHHSPANTHNRLLDRLGGYVGQLGNIAAIVSVSHAVSASFDTKPKRYRAKRRVIHNALPRALDQMLGSIGPKEKKVRTGRTVVAVGRLTHQKNYPLLIRAARHVRDVHIDIVGAGEDENALRQMGARLGVDDRVRFHGHVPRMEAMTRVASSDIFVQVSHYEGHSLALLEAARLGLPLIVSNVPVQLEAITLADGSRCGLVVDIDDDAALARMIMDLLEDDEAYACWSARALRLAESASFGRMVDAYAALVAP